MIINSLRFTGCRVNPSYCRISSKHKSTCSATTQTKPHVLIGAGRRENKSNTIAWQIKFDVNVKVNLFEKIRISWMLHCRMLSILASHQNWLCIIHLYPKDILFLLRDTSELFQWKFTGTHWLTTNQSSNKPTLAQVTGTRTAWTWLVSCLYPSSMTVAGPYGRGYSCQTPTELRG